MDVKFWAETDAYSNSIPYSFFPEDIFIIKNTLLNIHPHYTLKVAIEFIFVLLYEENVG